MTHLGHSFIFFFIKMSKLQPLIQLQFLHFAIFYRVPVGISGKKKYQQLAEIIIQNLDTLMTHLGHSFIFFFIKMSKLQPLIQLQFLHFAIFYRVPVGISGKKKYQQLAEIIIQNLDTLMTHLGHSFIFFFIKMSKLQPLIQLQFLHFAIFYRVPVGISGKKKYQQLAEIIIQNLDTLMTHLGHSFIFFFIKMSKLQPKLIQLQFLHFAIFYRVPVGISGKKKYQQLAEIIIQNLDTLMTHLGHSFIFFFIKMSKLQPLIQLQFLHFAIFYRVPVGISGKKKYQQLAEIIIQNLDTLMTHLGHSFIFFFIKMSKLQPLIQLQFLHFVIFYRVPVGISGKKKYQQLAEIIIQNLDTLMTHLGHSFIFFFIKMSKLQPLIQLQFLHFAIFYRVPVGISGKKKYQQLAEIIIQNLDTLMTHLGHSFIFFFIKMSKLQPN